MSCRSWSVLLLIFFSLPLIAAERRRAIVRPPFVPHVSHVFLVVLENVDEDVGEELPFFRTLERAGALLENYHALAHPSQPNYIAMVAGSAYGITDDKTVTIDVPHLGDLLESRGLTWKVYAENYPGNCYVGAIYGDPKTGAYLRRHVPFMNFNDVQDNLTRCNQRIVDATELDADIASGNLPNFAFYAPNNLHNGHDTNALTADAWLEQRFRPLLNDSRFTDDLVLIVTWDESSGSATDNAVSTVFVGNAVRAGVESAAYYDHYSLLRTIESLLATQTTLMKHDATATPITGIWR